MSHNAENVCNERAKVVVAPFDPLDYVSKETYAIVVITACRDLAKQGDPDALETIIAQTELALVRLGHKDAY